MEANLRDYTERLFAAAPKTRKTDELKDEMRENLIEKYRDLVAGGISETDAYNEVIRSIGDISALFRELDDEAAPMQAGPAPRYVPGPSGSGSGSGKAVKIVGIVTAALVVLVIAALILGFNLIFNKNSVFSGVTSGMVNSLRDAVSGSIESSDTFSFGTEDAGVGGTYSDNGVYAVHAADISAIRIDWINGGVELLPYNGDKIRFTETHGGADIEADEALRYGIKNGRLTIQFCAPRSWNGIKNFLTFDWNSLVYPKQLIVWIPESRMDSLEIIQVDSVSAAVRLSELSAEELVACSVSGGIDAKGLSCDKISLESISGEISIEASSMDALSCESTSGATDVNGIKCSDKLSAESISGDIGILMGSLPAELRAETVSGNVSLTAPALDSSGFTLRFDSVSGDLDSTTALELGKTKDSYVYGDGASEFKVNTVSGNLSISQTH